MLWRGQHAIPGADRLVGRLRGVYDAGKIILPLKWVPLDMGKRVFFVTNSSTLDRAAYCEKVGMKSNR